jgi:hypothetical protein
MTINCYKNYRKLEPIIQILKHNSSLSRWLFFIIFEYLVIFCLKIAVNLNLIFFEGLLGLIRVKFRFEEPLSRFIFIAGECFRITLAIVIINHSNLLLHLPKWILNLTFHVPQRFNRLHMIAIHLNSVHHLSSQIWYLLQFLANQKDSLFDWGIFCFIIFCWRVAWYLYIIGLNWLLKIVAILNHSFIQILQTTL